MTPEEFAQSEWAYAIECNPDGFDPSPTEGYRGSVAPFTFGDVARVIAYADGENDGPSWLVVLELADGRYVFADASCDYTGWDCQSGVRSVVAASLDNLIRWGIGSEERDRLGIYAAGVTS